MYPIKLEISNKVELKLGIKSSLPKVKQTLALLYLLWKANGQLSTYDYAAQTNDEKIRIKDEFIKLGQALKLAELVSDGVEAKYVINDGLVKVNGEVDTRRGRKVYGGDVISYNGQDVKVLSGNE